MFTFEFRCQTGWKTTFWKWPLLNSICVIQLGQCLRRKKDTNVFFSLKKHTHTNVFLPQRVQRVGITTLSQLNYTNGVQKRSFSKCGFSTCLAYKIKGKHVYSNIIVLFLQKITRGASWRPPGGPRVAPQNVRFKICPVFLLNELSTIYFSFKIYFWYILIVLGSCEVMGGLKIGSWGAKIRVFQKYFFQLFST